MFGENLLWIWSCELSTPPIALPGRNKILGRHLCLPLTPPPPRPSNLRVKSWPPISNPKYATSWRSLAASPLHHILRRSENITMWKFTLHNNRFYIISTVCFHAHPYFFILGVYHYTWRAQLAPGEKLGISYFDYSWGKLGEASRRNNWGGSYFDNFFRKPAEAHFFVQLSFSLIRLEFFHTTRKPTWMVVTR